MNFFRRTRWATAAVVIAAIGGSLAWSGPASSTLPPAITLRGEAPRSAAAPSGLVVVTPPVVVFDSPFDDDGLEEGGLDDDGSADSVDDVESDISSADSPDAGD